MPADSQRPRHIELTERAGHTYATDSQASWPHWLTASAKMPLRFHCQFLRQMAAAAAFAFAMPLPPGQRWIDITLFALMIDSDITILRRQPPIFDITLFFMIFRLSAIFTPPADIIDIFAITPFRLLPYAPCRRDIDIAADAYYYTLLIILSVFDAGWHWAFITLSCRWCY